MTGQMATCPVCRGSANCPECKTGRKDCPACDGTGICAFCDALGLVPAEHAGAIEVAYGKQLRRVTPVRHRQKVAA